MLPQATSISGCGAPGGSPAAALQLSSGERGGAGGGWREEQHKRLRAAPVHAWRHRCASGRRRRESTVLRSWTFGDGFLETDLSTASPTPLGMPRIYPPMWYTPDDDLERGRRAERRKVDDAVRLLYSGRPDAAEAALVALRGDLSKRLQDVLYSEADCRFFRQDYQGALDLLNHRQMLAHSQDAPDYKVHWMAALCLANMGRLPEACLQLRLARTHVTCDRAALCIGGLLYKLQRQVGNEQSDSDGEAFFGGDD